MVSALALEHPCDIHSMGARSAGRINLEDLLRPIGHRASTILKGFPGYMSRSISAQISLFVQEQQQNHFVSAR